MTVPPLRAAGLHTAYGLSTRADVLSNWSASVTVYSALPAPRWSSSLVVEDSRMIRLVPRRHERPLELALRRPVMLLERLPVHAEVAGLVELLLPGAAQLDQARLAGARVAQLRPPEAGQVGREPGAQLVPEAEVRGGELQVHRVVCRSPARALSTSVEARRLRSRAPGGYEGRFPYHTQRAHLLPAA